MPNVMKVLKDEIARIGRRETKAMLIPLLRRAVKAERSVSDLRKRVALLEKKTHSRWAERGQTRGVPSEAATGREVERAWISGKGIKSLRKRWGISHVDFAKLIGVTDQAVYNWEKKTGALRLRETTRAALFAIRHIGAKEAKRRLAEKAAVGKVIPRKRRKK